MQVTESGQGTQTPAFKPIPDLGGDEFPMNQGATSSQPSKQLCEAFGCLAEATLEISVKAGRHGVISLKVCKNCLVRFHDS